MDSSKFFFLSDRGNKCRHFFFVLSSTRFYPRADINSKGPKCLNSFSHINGRKSTRKKIRSAYVLQEIPIKYRARSCTGVQQNICSCTILAPILLPVVASYGVDPVHFGIIMTLNLAIGFITPPYGANLFVGSAIGKIPFQRLVKWIWGFIAVAVLALLIVTYFPGFFMWMV